MTWTNAAAGISQNVSASARRDRERPQHERADDVRAEHQPLAVVAVGGDPGREAEEHGQEAREADDPAFAGDPVTASTSSG